MKLRPPAAAVAVAMVVSVCGQEAPAKKLRVQGQVVNLVTGEPVRKAEVKLTPAPARKGGYAVITDAQGRFVFADAAPGHYSLTASHTGFIDARYGARNSLQAGSVLNVSAIEPLNDLLVRIAPLGVIAGKVIDEEGEPIPRSAVEVFKETFVRGSKLLVPVGKEVSNDRGEYRIAGLAPGEYVAQAYPPDANPAEGTPRQALTAVCFPAALVRAQAERISVGAGAVIGGIDIPLRRVPVMRVKGRLIDGETGKPMIRATVALTPKDSLTPRNPARTGNDGRFEVAAVAAGLYTVLLLGPLPEQISVVHSFEVAGRDIDNLEIKVTAPKPISVAIAVDGDKKLGLKGIEVVLAPSGGMNFYGTASGRTLEDGRFQLKNLSPVRYNIAVGRLPEDTWVKSIVVAGKEVLGQEIDWGAGVRGDIRITIAADAASVSGLVANENGPANGAMVVLLPADASRRHDIFDRIVPVDQFGAFTIRGVAPMEYVVFAFEELEVGAWQDPDLLSGVESYGQSLTVVEGGALSLQLKAVPARRE